MQEPTKLERHRITDTVRWFFLPIDEALAKGFTVESLSIERPRVSTIYRGNTYKMDTLFGMETDLSRMPSVTSGFRGLRSIKQGLIDVYDCPNTVDYIQLSGFDPKIHKYKTFGLLYRHPANDLILDFVIQVPDSFEYNDVIINCSIFAPHPINSEKNMSLFIHNRRHDWDRQIESHILIALDAIKDLSCVDKEAKMKFYKGIMANKRNRFIKKTIEEKENENRG